MLLGYIHFDTKSLVRFIALFLFVATLIGITSNNSHAQATLSLQGILKKSNGAALEDGTYNIIFKIYPANSAPNATPLWTEQNPNVELNGGIYSVILGEIEDLDLPFDQDYELGVQLGSQEMSPRIRLTSAPYALALRGSSNQFPSSGPVLADRITVAEGIIANQGAPLVNDVDGSKGYSFKNDNDSGLFSTGSGEASLYVNGVEKLEVTGSGINLLGNTTVHGSLGTNNINIYNNGGINYSSGQGSFQGWRLAAVDEFNTGNQGWQSYAPLSGYWTAINQGSPNGGINNTNFGIFAGYALAPTSNRQTLKKQFSIAGNFSQVKVKFRYYFLDTWDQGLGDQAYAGFATDSQGSNFRVAWRTRQEFISYPQQMSQFATALSFQGQTNISDHWIDAEMTALVSSNSFWVYIGAALDSNGDVNDENYAIGYVEIWVK